MVRPLKKNLKFGMTCPVPPWRQRYTHSPSCGFSQCPSAVLSASLVLIICTPPSSARPLRSLLVHPHASHGSPRVLRLLAGALLVVVFAGQLVRFAGCRACGVPYHAVSCGSGNVRVGASVQSPEARVARLVLWCRVSRSARRAGLGVTLPCLPAGAGGACRSRAVSPGPIACPGEGSGGNKGIRVSVKASLSLLDAVSFSGCGERVPRNILAG